MMNDERPQIYLITPPTFDLEVFPGLLGRVLDGVDVACLRLAVATRDEEMIARAADALRDVAHQRDVAIVIERHTLLVERLGLDGVHLTDGGKNLRTLRKDLGADAIIGAYCGNSRHEGMGAAEAGADYVAFGPVGASALERGEQAEGDLFGWWSEMIEVPVVAEGGLTVEKVRDLARMTDFFGIGDEIWGAEDPLAALQVLMAAMG
jgi:thiamine-phosphate pyrophosphorylase